MATFDERKRHKPCLGGDDFLGGDQDVVGGCDLLLEKDDLGTEPSTYYEASKGGITYFEEYVKKYPPINPENLPRFKGIEGALFYEYGDEGNMFMNEAIFMILISYGYEFSNDLFALFVCGSIYIEFGNEIQNYHPRLADCIEKYKNLEININDEAELIAQTGSFIHYMYDTESNNQGPYEDALLGIPSSIRSYMNNENKPLFPNFKCYF